jgi:hypothetical protein
LNSIGNARKDKAVTNEVCARKRADSTAGRWSNTIWPADAIAPIQQIDGKIRKYVAAKTLPWIDDGRRLLPSTLLQEVTDRIRQFKYEREACVADFLGNYHVHVDHMRTLRGDLFRDTDYPPIPKLADKFGFTFGFEPVPHQDDFRLNLAADQRKEMEDSVRAALGQAEAIARRELVNRILEPLRHMAFTLSKSEPGKIYDSLLANVLTIADAIPDFNVTNDPRLDEIHDKIKARFSFVTTDEFRNNNLVRARAVRHATEIADGIDAFMGAEEPADLHAIPA